MNRNSSFVLLSIVLCLLFAPTLSSALEEVRTPAECAKLHPDDTSPVQEVTCTSGIKESQTGVDKAYVSLHVQLEKISAKDGDAVDDGIIERYLPNLEKAEKAWLSYRDAECNYEGSGSGTMGSSDRISCIADMNRTRAAELSAESKRFQ